MPLEPLSELAYTGEGVFSSNRERLIPIPGSLRIPPLRKAYARSMAHLLRAQEVILSRDDLVIVLTINGDSREYP